MDEYISKENYCKNICHCANEYCDKASCPILTAPAADVAPVVHCHRVDDGCFWDHCSECGADLLYGANYCYSCGAKIDGADG